MTLLTRVDEVNAEYVRVSTFNRIETLLMEQGKLVLDPSRRPKVYAAMREKEKALLEMCVVGKLILAITTLEDPPVTFDPEQLREYIQQYTLGIITHEDYEALQNELHCNLQLQNNLTGVI